MAQIKLVTSNTSNLDKQDDMHDSGADFHEIQSKIPRLNL